MDQVIETDGLTRLYGPGRGIENLNLAISRGEIFGCLGPNGAGKTTTIRLLMGQVRAQRGRFSLFGTSGGPGAVAIRRRIGYLPGELGFHNGFSGEQTLRFLEKLTGAPAVHRDWLCTQLKLTPQDRRRRIGSYSKGMKQKLGIIQALQHDPELLILDEPTTGLDPLVQEAFFDILHELRDRGRTIFFSSHVLNEVQRLCDRVGVIKDARLVLNTTMSDMANRADRLLWIKLRETVEKGSIVEAGQIPSIARARFIRPMGGGWLLYLTAPEDSGRIVNELARLQPLDFRFEPALEESFLKLYGVTLRSKQQESPQP